MEHAAEGQYEYQAPRFYDFAAGENADDIANADTWFDTRRESLPRESLSSSQLTLSDLETSHHDRSSSPLTSSPQRPPRTPQSSSIMTPRRSKRSLVLTQPQSPHLATASRSRPTARIAHQEPPKRIGTKEQPRKVIVSKAPLARTLTEPTAPRFATDARIRTHRVVSTEERILTEMQSSQFKAHGVNRKVLQSAGDLGVPKVQKAPLTTPQPMSFATTARLTLRASQTKGTTQDTTSLRPIVAHP